MSVPSCFGRYRVRQVLGRGEMGAVYLAEDPAIGRLVAIKAIRTDLDVPSGELRERRVRFRQEIVIAGAFSHPNIVTLYDVGDEQGITFIAMEHVDGESLASLMAREPILEPDRAVAILRQVANALDYAHERQIVHRDVKPANVLLDGTGAPKITDFGLARLGGSTLTRDGTVFGTPAYMSPEQAGGESLTGASDQFSLAVIAYELLTGEPPFAGESANAVIYRILHEDPVPPDVLNPRIPKLAGRALMRSLSKRPSERYPSCGELAETMAAMFTRYRSDPSLSLPHGVAAHRRLDGANLPQDAVITRTDSGARRPFHRLLVRARALLTWRAAAAAAASTALLALALIGMQTLAPKAPWTAPAGGEVVELGATGALQAGNAADRREPVASDPGDPEPQDGPPASGGASEASAPMSFRVTSRPPGARVTLDGVPMARPTPVEVELDPSRKHRLELELEGYETLVWDTVLQDRHVESGDLHFPLVLAEDRPAEAASRGRAGEAPLKEAPAEVPFPAKVRDVEPRVPAGSQLDARTPIVILTVEIDTEGNVQVLKVLRGLTTPLDLAAVDAVQRWKYAPTVVDGERVRVRMNVTVTFGPSLHFSSGTVAKSRR